MRILYRVLLCVFAGAVAIRLLMWSELIIFLIGVRGDITYPEGARVYAVDRVARGKPLYQDFRHLPHIMVPYGPAYFYVSGTISRFCTPDSFQLYVVSRAVSLSSVILLVGVCLLWARELV